MFFRQRTAYERRISDWSSDVCSSDLSLNARGLSDASAASNPVTPTASSPAPYITATITPSPFHKDSVNGPNRQIDGPTAAGSEGSAPYTYRGEEIGGNDSIIDHDPTQAQGVLRSSGFGTTKVRSEEHKTELPTLMRH